MPRSPHLSRSFWTYLVVPLFPNTNDIVYFDSHTRCRVIKHCIKVPKIGLFYLLWNGFAVSSPLNGVGDMAKRFSNFPTGYNSNIWFDEVENPEMLKFFQVHFIHHVQFYWPFAVLSSPSPYVWVTPGAFFFLPQIFFNLLQITSTTVSCYST